MPSLRKEDRETLAEIDVIEQAYDELLKEYAELKSAFERLRHKRRKLLDGIEGLVTKIEEKKSEQ